MADARRRAVWQELLIQAVALGGALLSMRYALKALDPYREQREQASKRLRLLRKYLGRNLDLNEYEQLLASSVVNPAHLDESIDDISGLDDLLEELEMKVIMPMLQPEMFCTTLFKPARGVLLYGPPGTGKTMLAKALAKHSGCYFLNITASSIMSKWLGDSNRLTRAIFTLAEKLQPCIIFIDEVDAMLGKRGSSSEHEASLQLKTEFMQLWDGMESTRGQRIVVMGATNRPGMVDEAVLRRFSIQHEVGLPNQEQRRAILRTYLLRHSSELKGVAVASHLMHNVPTVGSGGQGALDWVAAATEAFSGSDLMELCAQAAQRALADYVIARRRSPLAAPGPGSTPASTTPTAAAARPSHPATGSTAGPAGLPALSSSSRLRAGASSAQSLASSAQGGAGEEEVEQFEDALAGEGEVDTEGEVPFSGEAAGVSGSAGGASSAPAEVCGGASSRASGAVAGSRAAGVKGVTPQRAGSAAAATPVIRPVTLADFQAVLPSLRPATSKANEYMQRTGFGGLGGAEGGGNMGLLLEMLLRMAQAQK